MTQNTAAQEPSGPLQVALQHTTRLLASNPALAIEQAGEILKTVPHHPLATLLLGIAHRSVGDVGAALRALEPLSATHPRWAPAFYELGLTYLERESAEPALKALRRAVYLDPNIPDAWRIIGDQLTAQGDGQGADSAYAQHLRASTNDPRLMAAASALCEGRIPEAEYRLREHLKQFPTDVAAIRMLAEVAGRLGRYGDAEKLLTRALELAPSFHAARHNLALVLNKQNKYADSLAQIELLTAAEPRDSGHRNLKAVVLAKIGDYPQALDIYADILAKHPGQAMIWMSFAHALSSAGRTQDSIAAYRQCLALQPHNGEAYWSLANLKTFRFTEAEVAVMRALLTGSKTTEDDRAHLHFAIGKALEDAGQYADSFLNYSVGNALRLAKVGYNPDNTSILVKRSKALFTREFMAARRGYGGAAPDPIFIVGLPRAGSTLVEQILASHSLVEGTMELPNIMAIALQLGGKTARAEESAYPDVLKDLSAADCRALGEQYLAETQIQRQAGKPYFIDKMPNNFLHVGLIQLILPQAKIIDARRHPIACCFSGYKQNFAMGQRFTYSLEHIARYYRDYVELMAHYDKIVPRTVHRVVYERLVEDTEIEVRRLLHYCGLPFEDSCLRFYENDRAVRTASAQQVRKPIFREGIDQWRHFEPWLDPLKESLGDVLRRYPDTPEY
jgi:tetratricopeptide (TPR) repeat protein